jgi:tetratricopeptide (TPR) repeat protein
MGKPLSQKTSRVTGHRYLVHIALALSMSVPACHASAPGASEPAAASPPRTVPVTTRSAEARAAFERGEELLWNTPPGNNGGVSAPVLARPHFAAAVAADPEFAQGHLRLATTSTGDERVHHMARARELAAGLSEVERLWIEGSLVGLTGLGDFDAMRKVAELAPDDWKVRVMLAGVAQWHSGDMATARAEYERTIELVPDRPNSYYQLSAVCASLHDFACAERAIERYIALVPGHATGLERQGEILLQAGRIDEAERSFQAAMALDPTYPAENGIAAVQMHRGDFTGAITSLRRALEKIPTATVEDLGARLGLTLDLVWLHELAGQEHEIEPLLASWLGSVQDLPAYQPRLRVEYIRAQRLVDRGELAQAAQTLDAALAELRPDVESDVRASRLTRTLSLLRLEVAVQAGDAALATSLGAAILAGRADDRDAKRAQFLLAVQARDDAAMLTALDELRGDPESHADARLLAADALARAGKLQDATRLRQEVAGDRDGLGSRSFLLRRRAASALEPPR